MKKSLIVFLGLFIVSGCAFAMTSQEDADGVYAALKSCSNYSDETVKISEVSTGRCSYEVIDNGKTTSCNMPLSMARKLAIFKTTEELNEAQVADMNDIVKKYCKTK